MKNKVAPSILAADFSKIGAEVELLEENGADLVHCDVMDGSFVKPITFGAQMVKEVRRHTSLPLDVHLMIEHPKTQIDNFVKAGANMITVHYEACVKISETYLQESLELIREKGCACGVVINPATSVEVLRPYLPYVDMVLIMSVVPGYGGQSFIPESLDKLRAVRAMCSACGKPNLDIEVDGGITEGNVAEVLAAGANVIVAGSAVYRSKDKRLTIAKLRGEI